MWSEKRPKTAWWFFMAIYGHSRLLEDQRNVMWFSSAPFFPSLSRANWKFCRQNFWNILRLSTPAPSLVVIFKLSTLELSFAIFNQSDLAGFAPEVEVFCWQSLANLSWHIFTVSIEKTTPWLHEKKPYASFNPQLSATSCCIVSSKVRIIWKHPSPMSPDQTLCCKMFESWLKHRHPWCPWPKLKNSRWMSCSSFEMPWWRRQWTGVVSSLFKVTWNHSVVPMQSKSIM